MSSEKIAQLRALLECAPVMGKIHPLIPLCLASETEISDNAQSIAQEMDDILPHRERPLLIRSTDLRYTQRFLPMDVTEPPDPSQIDMMLPERISYARNWLLTNHKIADRVYSEANAQGYQAVVVMLLDGLSYYDILHWPEKIIPCFIDGPTITFDRTKDNAVRTDVGFPSIIGDPPLVRRFAKLGIRHARGFSYWNREENDVTEILFRGIPLKRILSIEEALETIKEMNTSGFYIQIVREGLDGLAHQRREVTVSEIESTVDAIRTDMLQLVNSLQSQELRSALYLIADHGILWKKQHEFKLIPLTGSYSPRYSTEPQQAIPSSDYLCKDQTYNLYHYPFIGRRIRSNDSGVHGGLSCWESIVPFLRVEVIP